jgi:(1->4)-alpha-D-glucan 1-alpha-D-glucosylmutase
MDGGIREKYTGRIHQHMLKALREAKTNTRWDESNIEWEDATNHFIDRVIKEPGADFFSLARQVMELGALNSLSQTLLKLTAPEMPDIFQGNELWQFILTDPDNRGAVDFFLRQKILDSLAKQTPADLLKAWQNGAVKMFLIRTVLQYRRLHPELFKEGAYIPLKFEGKYKDSCLGFARTLDGNCVITLVSRLTKQIGFPPIGDRWDNTSVDLAKLNIPAATDLFTGRRIQVADPLISHIFKELPFALLIT